jgi:YEATS domain-containing protein 4
MATASNTNTAIASAPITPRLSRTTACLPIVYGSLAYYLGKKAQESQTHEWTLFLRGPNHEDLSPAISKVVFQLHPSFAEPTREILSPPYSVTERGWGEFEAGINIHWKDATEKTTIVSHIIKLYPPGTPPNVLPTDTETPVLAEVYDEVVFTDPTESFFQALTQVPVMPKLEPLVEEDDEKEEETKSSTGKNPARKSASEYMNTLYSDQEDFLTLIAAQKFLQDELVEAKRRFQLVNNEIATVDQKMMAMQQQKQREAAISAATAASSIPSSATATTLSAPKSAPPGSAATTTTNKPSSGKKPRAPSSQRKRPGSQTKKVKTGGSTATAGAGSDTKSATTASAASIGKAAPKK